MCIIVAGRIDHCAKICRWAVKRQAIALHTTATNPKWTNLTWMEAELSGPQPGSVSEYVLPCQFSKPAAEGTWLFDALPPETNIIVVSVQVWGQPCTCRFPECCDSQQGQLPPTRKALQACGPPSTDGDSVLSSSLNSGLLAINSGDNPTMSLKMLGFLTLHMPC